MKMVFPKKSIKANYKRGKTLKEILIPPSFPSTKNVIVDSINNYNKTIIIMTIIILWFSILPLNVLQQLSTIKVKDLYLVIVSM